ncbi:Carboxy-S-adenosyl-L-methionine synthase [BD1-7 clade bacterium]|uniref:Carboxy-S-adenosyl-L-methionine synthase n=1 Tax=BD1-7 clade bacterium TaxID=2029982 RepID=A0A5S9QTV1_9GAMM|nr:Carboxy-S-adenosyl-L-methionine synthase [BD1-7 clade bacterium]CAA0122716.1 Carboxy-S-adenosyl-L-methionine synthase [BD1-7 clade bacterium]
MNQPDKLYAKTRQIVNAFQFDENVARVFSDMIRRSVPGYPMMLDMLGVVAETHVKDDTRCYDLGCSLGASTLAIRQNLQATGADIVAIDNSSAMTAHCQEVIAQDASHPPVDVICGDICDIDFATSPTPASLVCLNLTLQFIDQEKRLPLLAKIADSLVDGGVLFLSEKLLFTDTFEQNHLTDLHHQFKKHQGYSDLEIAQKRSAIENVLIPETLEVHRERLYNAGFRQVIVALQCFNFCTLIAYK